MKNVVSIARGYAEFNSAWVSGLNGLFKAAQIYVQTIDALPEAKKYFKEQRPEISNTGWAGIEKVGRGTWIPQLLVDSTYGAEKVRQLPASDQKTAYENGVKVLSSDNSTINLKVQKLTPKQANLVFATDHIRDVLEQKAIIETSKLFKKIEVPKDDYIAYNKKLKTVTFSKGYTATIKEILNIAQELQA